MPGAAFANSLPSPGLAGRVLSTPGARQAKFSWGGPSSDRFAAMTRSLGAGAATWGRGHQPDLAGGSELAQTSRGALSSKMGFQGINVTSYPAAQTQL